jgi:hypothetical protein
VNPEIGLLFNIFAVPASAGTSFFVATSNAVLGLCTRGCRGRLRASRVGRSVLVMGRHMKSATVFYRSEDRRRLGLVAA